MLLPISTHLVHFLNKRQPKLQARDAGIWWGTLGKLQLMLRKAARALFQNDKVISMKIFYIVHCAVVLQQCNASELSSNL